VKGFFILFLNVKLLFFAVSCAPLQIVDPVYSKSGDLAGDSAYEDKFREENYRPVFYNKAFPMDNNKYVDAQLRLYSAEGKLGETMRRYLERSGRYVDFMGNILEEEGLSRDLVYKSMAESGFMPDAESTQGAVGYWQFISSTGKKYGLKIDSHIDERKDFVLSTQAAARYLKDLYNIFQDWRLSIAAYNCGENKMIKTIKKNGSNDFWHLVALKAIPRETRFHVPKVIAMRKIALNPRKYGFADINYHPPLDYGLVYLNGLFSLSYLSEYWDIPHKDLLRLNSKFNTDTVYSNIRVPAYL